MKAQNIIINFLVATVAVLAGHIFWPGSRVIVGEPGIPQLPGQAVFANTQPSTNATSVISPPRPAPMLITPDVRARLDKAREAVFISNPGLKREEDAVNTKLRLVLKQGATASTADRTEAMTELKEHSHKMREAMISIDPELRSIMDDLGAKLKSTENSPRVIPMNPTNSVTTPNLSH